MKLTNFLYLALLVLFGCQKDFQIGQTTNALKSTGGTNHTNYNQIWSDEFLIPGAPNSTYWNTDPGWRYRFRYPTNILTFHGKNESWDIGNINEGYWEKALCVTYLDPTVNSIIIDNGYLKIKSKHFPNANHFLQQADFSTGCLTLKTLYKYKYVEIRAWVPAGDAIGSAFWLPTDPYIGEYDIFETNGWQNNHYPMNYGLSNLTTYPLDKILYDLTGGFHIYGFSWNANEANWYVDNKLVRTVIGNTGINNDCHLTLSINLPPAADGCDTIMMKNVRNNTSLVNFNDFQIDYVRVYDKRPTTALFSILNNFGNLDILSDFVDWSLNWDIIVSGNFNGDQYKDLFLYSKSQGKALLLSCDGTGNVTNIQEINGWRSTLDQIIPGDFGGSSLTDLLLYDKSKGEAEFFSIDASYYHSFTNWPKTYKIISGNFDGLGKDDLMFYNTNSDNIDLGTVDFKSVSANYNFSNIKPQVTGWRKTWDIIAGKFGGSGLTDLLLYDKTTNTGEASFYSPDGSFNSTATFTGWRKTWKILSGNFDISNSNDELLFYDTNNNGQAYFYTVSSPSGINLYKSYTDWNPTWDIIVPGQFGGTNNDDLLFYDN